MHESSHLAKWKLSYLDDREPILFERESIYDSMSE